MGCKCANSGEKEDEIQRNEFEDTNRENEFNKNINKNDDLLSLNNKVNYHQKEENSQNSLNDRKNLNLNQENNINDNNINYDPNEKYRDYPIKIVELINNIREDPVGYSDIIDNSIKNIMEEENKKDPPNMRLIFKKK